MTFQEMRLISEACAVFETRRAIEGAPKDSDEKTQWVLDATEQIMESHKAEIDAKQLHLWATAMLALQVWEYVRLREMLAKVRRQAET